MAQKNNNFNFNIPIPLIVAAYIFYWPVGIVLTILRAVSNSDQKNNANLGHKSGEEMRQENLGNNRTYASQQPYHRTGQAPGQSYPGYQQTTQTWQSARQQSQPNYSYQPQTTNPYYEEQVSRRAKKKAKKSGVYAGLITGGVISAIIFGISLLVSMFSFTPTGPTGISSLISMLGSLSIPGLFAIGFFVGAQGYKNREVEMNRIKTMIGNKESYNLSKLASASGKSVKKVRKQLQRMIDKGEFGDTAYIDLGSNNFMRNPDAEPDDPEGFDYRTVYGDVFEKNQKKQKKNAQEEVVEEVVEEDDSDRARFDKIIAEIRRLNDEIEDEAVSERIDRIEEHTRNIFDYVTDHPEAMPQIRTFLNYYLPTTLKLLESYSRIERVGVAGENMKKSKENIESILDLLVVGFEQQVDQLFKNESIDISSDIRVLETMMQKDGLNGKSDFDLSSYTDGYSDEISDELGGGAMAQRAPEDK